MSRSLKKGPFISVKLEKKVAAMEETGKKSVIKTCSRASMIAPDYFCVHFYFPPSYEHVLFLPN